MKIAVTGAMGTGKSTLVAWLASRLPHYETYNIDTLVAGLYQHPEFVAALRERFGVADREAVSQRVFDDAPARSWLESLSARLLGATVADILSRPNVIVEFPLLFEMSAPYARFDAVLATWCPPDIQRERIYARDDRDPERTERMLAAQHDASLKAGLADLSVDMETGPDETVLQALNGLSIQRALRNRCDVFFDNKGVWPVLAAAYGAPGRCAHDMTYLERVLTRFDEHRALAHQPKAVELALWFHLAGLSTQGPFYASSPVRSARLMWQTLAHVAPGWLRERDVLPLASELLASLAPMAVESAHLRAAPRWASDAALFLDMLLMEYAQPEETLVVRWDASVRELSAAPAVQAFFPGALTRLASRPRLLQTEALHAGHEAAVRKGLDALIRHAGTSLVPQDDVFESNPLRQEAA